MIHRGNVDGFVVFMDHYWRLHMERMNRIQGIINGFDTAVSEHMAQRPGAVLIGHFRARGNATTWEEARLDNGGLKVYGGSSPLVADLRQFTDG